MSGDWRRLHRVCGVSSGSPENHWIPWLIHKAKTEEPKMEVQQHQTGLTGDFLNLLLAIFLERFRGLSFWNLVGDVCMNPSWLLTVYFGTPNMFITLWFGFIYGTNPPLGTLIT
jgi:hypothetical protein